ncbi:MaoC family dehydratase [Siccirubricoccus phaeus]|uniref:MaoC family dehydratase n=1 Tax=Siccirubricoccus phaeus TaxID=2595053 RepID=UPI0011F141EE|nr:MaoC family dehydratase [Siccirubricoccus phaeus]
MNRPPQGPKIYLEDLTPGRLFTAGPVTVTEAEIIDFARRYDPQPFHTDPEAAKASFFGGLAASGWHTAAITMAMVVQAAGNLAGGIIGGGGELQWTKPVRPGDQLRLEIEVLEVSPSRSRPDRGAALMRNRTLNQAGEEVQVFTVRLIVPKRPRQHG